MGLRAVFKTRGAGKHKVETLCVLKDGDLSTLAEYKLASRGEENVRERVWGAVHEYLRDSDAESEDIAQLFKDIAAEVEPPPADIYTYLPPAFLPYGSAPDNPILTLALSGHRPKRRRRRRKKVKGGEE